MSSEIAKQSRVEGVKAGEIHDLIEKYGNMIESIHEKQTQGDHKWKGLLIRFLIEYEEMWGTSLAGACGDDNY